MSAAQQFMPEASSSSSSSSRPRLQPAALVSAAAEDDAQLPTSRELDADPELADPRAELRRLGITGPGKDIKKAGDGSTHVSAVDNVPGLPGTYAAPPSGRDWRWAVPEEKPARPEVFDDECELPAGSLPYIERRPIPTPAEAASSSASSRRDSLVPHKKSLKGALQSMSTNIAAPLKLEDRWASAKQLATPRGLLGLAKRHKFTIAATIFYAIFFGTLANTIWKDKLGFKGHIMLVILYFLMFALIKDFSAGLAFLGALTACLMFDVVSQADALAGFSNAGVFQVGVLYIIAAGIEETGALDYALRRVLGTPKSKSNAIFRISASCIFLSTFLNNTPIVAMM
eukprot:tig00000344_g24288.t1